MEAPAAAPPATTGPSEGGSVQVLARSGGSPEGQAFVTYLSTTKQVLFGGLLDTPWQVATFRREFASTLVFNAAARTTPLHRGINPSST